MKLVVSVVLVAAALVVASPTGRLPPNELHKDGSAVTMFGRSHPGRLSLVDPLRPRPLRTHRKKARELAHVEDNNLGADPGRLPTILKPTSYSLTLTPHLSGQARDKFDGKAIIYFDASAPSDRIILHSKELIFTKEDCKVSSALSESGLTDFATVVDLQFDTVLEFATLTLSTNLQAGSRYVLTIKYSGWLNDDMDGFYRSSYVTSSGEKRWLATTQFEPTGARRAFPCWDEPSFKATYEILIQRDSSRTAISNMPLENSRDLGNGQVLDTFMTTPIMSSYLVAFIVSDFKNQANSYNNFTTWAREDIIAGGYLSQEVGPKALEILEDFNGVKYTLPKMDQAAIPDFSAGAMENWGLVTYREPDLIVTADTTTPGFESIATVICHEFGHQWTGDLVTLDWWSHTWLNEGFASFFENMICDQIKPEWNLEDKMLPTFYHVAMESDVRETQVAMSSPVASDAEDINDHFGVISYDKGGSVLRMLYYALTPDVFKKGMKRYLTDNMYENANPEKLFDAMNKEAEISNLHQLPLGTNFSEVASTWTEQPGVPVLQATRDYATTPGRVRFEQQRFLYAPAKDASNVGQKYWIPLVVTTQSAKDFSTSLPQGWLSPDVNYSTLDSGAAANEWVLVNPRQTGYFRVNYDDKNWQLLTAAILADQTALPASSRAQLLNDALALARAGQLDYALALPFLQTLKAERSVVVWQTATTAIKYLLARLDTTDAIDSFWSLINEVTADAYSSVGYRGSDSEPHESAYLRYIVTSLACNAGNENCLSAAASALNAWLADAENNPLQVDTKVTTLCSGVRGADAATFESMRQKWLAEKVDDVKYSYASALGCTSDKSLLKSLLADAIAKKYSSDDGVMLFNAIYDRLDNHQCLLEFVEDNADAIRNAFGNNFDIQVLDGLIRDIRSRTEFNEVKSWVEIKYKNTSDLASFDEAFASAENELQTWADKYYNKVSVWVASQTTPTTLPPTHAPTSQTVPLSSSPQPPAPTTQPPAPTTQPPAPTTQPPAPPTKPPAPPTKPPASPTPTPAGAASTTTVTALLILVALFASLIPLR